MGQRMWVADMNSVPQSVTGTSTAIQFYPANTKRSFLLCKYVDQEYFVSFTVATPGTTSANMINITSSFQLLFDSGAMPTTPIWVYTAVTADIQIIEG